MPFTKSAVELFISARAASISTCGASDMLSEVPESEHWLSNFGLSVIFNDFPPTEMRPLIINFIRRIYCAFHEYNNARLEVLKLVQDSHGRWSPYFSALNNFESTISQLYLAINSIRKHTSINFFTKGDGSIEERLNIIYNASKHQLSEDELPVWFTNENIACNQASLSFIEVEKFMFDMARIVKGLYSHEVTLNNIKP